MKLALMVWRNGERNCCLMLMKANDIAENVRETLGPLLSEITSR